jgi:hypothetical protein
MCGTTQSSMTTLNLAVAQVLKRPHYLLDVNLTYVRWLWRKYRRRARKRPFLGDLNELKEPPSKSRA